MAFRVIEGGRSRVQSVAPARQLLSTAKPDAPARALRRLSRYEIEKARIRQIGWLAYPDGGSGRLVQAVHYPRLKLIFRTYKDERPPETLWLVDGSLAQDVDEAADLLSQPAVLLEAERRVLTLVPEGWLTPNELRAIIAAGTTPAERSDRTRRLRGLADKGFLEVEDNRIRRHPS